MRGVFSALPFVVGFVALGGACSSHSSTATPTEQQCNRICSKQKTAAQAADCTIDPDVDCLERCRVTAAGCSTSALTALANCVAAAPDSKFECGNGSSVPSGNTCASEQKSFQNSCGNDPEGGSGGSDSAGSGGGNVGGVTAMAGTGNAGLGGTVDSGGSGGVSPGGSGGVSAGGTGGTSSGSGNGGAGDAGAGGTGGGGTGGGGAGGTGGGTGGGGAGGTGGSGAICTSPATGATGYCVGKALQGVPMPVSDHFVADGYMNDVAGVTNTASCVTRAPGAPAGACYTAQYAPTVADSWGGVAWRFGGSWDGPGLCVFAGAKKVGFYARGQIGGESVQFGAMGLTCEETTLTTKWTYYEVPVSAVDFNESAKKGGVATGFFWAASGPSKKFYIDDIRWLP